MNDDRNLLLRILGEGYERKAWHGPNLRGVLRGLNPNQAFWRPAPERHNIWELMLHCAYWKFVAWRRITGSRGARFPRAGSNFFPTPDPTDAAWRDDLELLDDSHHALRGAVETLSAAALASNSRTIYGVAMHDVYHAGQIRVLARLYGK